jgi:hypothetical protein
MNDNTSFLQDSIIFKQKQTLDKHLGSYRGTQNFHQHRILISKKQPTTSGAGITNKIQLGKTTGKNNKIIAV